MRQIVKKQTVRLTAAEYAQLKRLAEEADLSMEAVIRQLIMGTPLRPRPPAEYAALLRELAAIGNNINQIAYWANARKGITDAEIANAVSLVRQVWQTVKDGM